MAKIGGGNNASSSLLACPKLALGSGSGLDLGSGSVSRLLRLDGVHWRQPSAVGGAHLKTNRDLICLTCQWSHLECKYCDEYRWLKQRSQMERSECAKPVLSWMEDSLIHKEDTSNLFTFLLTLWLNMRLDRKTQ